MITGSLVTVATRSPSTVCPRQRSTRVMFTTSHPLRPFAKTKISLSTKLPRQRTLVDARAIPSLIMLSHPTTCALWTTPSVLISCRYIFLLLNLYLSLNFIYFFIKRNAVHKYIGCGTWPKLTYISLISNHDVFVKPFATETDALTNINTIFWHLEKKEATSSMLSSSSNLKEHKTLSHIFPEFEQDNDPTDIS